MTKLSDYEIQTLREVRDGSFDASGFGAAPIQAYEVLVHNGFVSVNAEITEQGRALLDDIDHIEVIEHADIDHQPLLMDAWLWGLLVVVLILIGAGAVFLTSMWPS